MKDIVGVALLFCGLMVLAFLLEISISAFIIQISSIKLSQGFSTFDGYGMDLGPHKPRPPGEKEIQDVKNLRRSSEEESSHGMIQQRTFQPTSIPHYAFVKFSSYRVSLKTFYIVGISSSVVREHDQFEVVHTCEWHPASKNSTEPLKMHSAATDFVATNASMIYIQFDENGMTYVPAIVNCTFGQDVGADSQGGLLVIRVSLTFHRWKKNVPTIVMEEGRGKIAYLITPSFQKPFKYAFCGPPMHTNVSAEWIKAWLTYHDYIWGGKAYFFFYNVGGLKDEDRVHFKEFWEAGILSIEDLTNPYIQTNYPMWYYHQLLYINDCLHRSRFLADFVVFLDFDEFLQVRLPNTMDSLLEKHKDSPWISFGSFPADFHHCSLPNKNEEEFPVAQMLWHDKQPECGHGDEDRWTCEGSQGRRKYLANTKLVQAAGVHRAAIPYVGGIIINASIARIIHFHGVLSPKNTLCKHLVAQSDMGSLAHLELDNSIARALVEAKQKSLLKTARRSRFKN